ncbi:GNAT family protein [Bacillus haimaensis]|uniref:GNAT family N-acetyltransferase n=1 Tax=Bacillus haimaensis TaxID=3160967 RepID=UPI003AA8F2D0
MTFYIRKMNRVDAEDILLWRYEAPYDFYNMENSEEALSELLDGSYDAVYSGDDRLFGYYCKGNSAQVPAGHAKGAYLDACLDVGLGMKPYLTGSGKGSSFFSFILDSLAEEKEGEAAFRLTVATFNKRAMALYSKFGFEEEISFEQNGVEFVTMVKPPL